MSEDVLTRLALLENEAKQSRQRLDDQDKLFHGEGTKDDRGLLGRVSDIEGNERTNKVMFSLFGALGTLAAQWIASLFQGAFTPHGP